MVERCPVCDTRINANVPTAGTEYEGTEYHFESAMCKRFFESDPGQYA